MRNTQSNELLDVEAIRKDFPILKEKIHGKPLVYLDNAATTQKPQSVIEALSRFYAVDCSNIHRGVHQLSERATKAYEEARVKVQKFIRAEHSKEIIFVRGATEGINLVAQTYGRTNVQAGDEIVVSVMEHHSNIVPWQLLCEEKKAHLRVIPINDRGELIIEEFAKLLTARTKLVAIGHVSNALGTINPVKEIIRMSHAKQVPVLIDGAQAVPHLPVDVQDLDCDFFTFSGHKMFGPTGVGVLYGKEKFLNAMPPYQGGGDMISSVSFQGTTYNDLPHKFEAGTPNIAGVIGLGAAIDYLNAIGMARILEYEHSLMAYATEALTAVPLVRLIGTAKEKTGAISFLLDDIHPHDVGTILDQEGVAIRTGHHCAQPLMDRFGIPATCRISLAFYNSREDIDRCVDALARVRGVFG